MTAVYTESDIGAACNAAGVPPATYQAIAAELQKIRAASGAAGPERPVCTYASGCNCDVPRPMPQGNKAWHCPKQQEHAAKVWNSISVDEGRSKP
jgi:hypothetical protein